MTIRFAVAPFKMVALTVAAGLIASPALAQRAGAFGQTTGQEIYEGICQGCHMPDAKGARGAGAYPALAGDARLATKEYPAMVVLRGQKAMPEFGSMFSDAQVAGVVTYIRTHFGNKFEGTITPEEVRALRPAPPTGTVAAPG